MHAHGGAVDAAERFAVFGAFAARVAEHESVGGQRNGFANVRGGEALGQRCGYGFHLPFSWPLPAILPLRCGLQSATCRERC